MQDDYSITPEAIRLRLIFHLPRVLVRGTSAKKLLFPIPSDAGGVSL